VVDLPAALTPVKVQDDGTSITQLGRGALAVTSTTATGTPVRALTCHLKSKLLTFPGHRFDTRDEAERARSGVYALDRRAAEAAAVRDCPPPPWPASGPSGRWWSAGTTTTPRTPPSCCSGHPAPRSAPAATRGPTKATRNGSRTSAINWPRRTTTPASTTAAPS
jgi:hypothetical protein